MTDRRGPDPPRDSSRTGDSGIDPPADSKARIALAIESSGPGGAEQIVLHLAEALRQMGHAIWIATLRPGWMTERAEALGIAVQLVPQRAGLDPGWIPRFRTWLRRERIQILHTHEFAMGAFGGAAALTARIPRIATVHGRHYLTERRHRALAYRLLHRTGMTLVAVSHDLAGYLAEGLGIRRDRIEVVHNGIALPEEAACEVGDAARRITPPCCARRRASATSR
jgi:glycosyltransferase involved in cell wall biosynthesis